MTATICHARSCTPTLSSPTTTSWRELDRLVGAIRGRPIMLEIWSVRAGRRELAAAVDRIERATELAESIAVVAQRAFAAPR
jgi:hypothetical protein